MQFWAFGKWRDLRLQYALTQEHERNGRVREFKFPVDADGITQAETLARRRILSEFGETGQLTSIITMEQ